MRTLAVFVVATIVFYLAIFFGWIAYAQYAHVSDREGGTGMAVAFVFAPVSAIALGAVAAFFLGGPRASRNLLIGGGIAGLLILAAFISQALGL